jgi:AraC-like DNA-binding protein
VTDSFDLLSDELQSSRPRGWFAEELALAAPWGIHAGGNSCLLYCVVQGRCWLEVKGDGTPVGLVSGDLALVMMGRDHSLRDSRDGPTIPLEDVLGHSLAHSRRPVFAGGEGPVSRLTCGGLRFERQRVSPLLASLPPCIVVNGIEGKPVAWVDETLRLIRRDAQPSRPGGQAVADHLAQVIFLQAVRASATTLTDEGGYPLTALNDADIAQVLNLMHARLETPWTVAALADRACLSRSAFAARFKTMVSKSPLQYLLECRMRRACDLLVDGRYGIKEIAAQVGYATAAAFSNAFKRWAGSSPGAYRQTLLSGPDGAGTGSRNVAESGRNPDFARATVPAMVGPALGAVHDGSGHRGA